MNDLIKMYGINNFKIINLFLRFITRAVTKCDFFFVYIYFCFFSLFLQGLDIVQGRENDTVLDLPAYPKKSCA